MKKFFKSIKFNILGSAVASIVLGILLVVYSELSLTLLCKGVGFIILLTGVGFILGYLHGTKGGFFVKLELIVGSVLGIVGGFIILFPKEILSIAPMVFGLFMIYHGITNVKQAWELQDYGDKEWWFPVLVSAITIFPGILIMKNPFDTFELLMQVIGACLIFDGLANIMLVGRFIKFIRSHQKKIETEKKKAEAVEDKKEASEGES